MIPFVVNVERPVPPWPTVRPEIAENVAAVTRPYESTVNEDTVLLAAPEPVAVYVELARVDRPPVPLPTRIAPVVNED